MRFELVTDRRIADESYQRILFTDQLVLDLGAKNRMNKFLTQYRNKPIKARYFCTDIQFGTLDFVSNGQMLPLADESVDALICNAVIEHVQEPWSLASEIYRVLRKGGTAFLYAPFLFPYHAENAAESEHSGGYDCYRYTLDGLRYLFSGFELMRASPVEYGLVAWWRMVTFYRYPRFLPYAWKAQRFLERRRGRPLGVNQATGYDIWLEK